MNTFFPLLHVLNFILLISKDFCNSVSCSDFTIACNKYKSFAYVAYIEKDDSKGKANIIFHNVQKRTQHKWSFIKWIYTIIEQYFRYE